MEGCAIGVYGLHPAAGTTHVVMLLASYFSDIHKCKTEVFETGEQKSFHCFEHFLQGKSSRNNFRTKRCIYYKYEDLNSNIHRKEGRICIYDFGCQDKAVKSLLLCDEKWIVGSTGIFHAGDWEAFFEKKEVKEQIARKGTSGFHLLKNHGDTAKQSDVSVKFDGRSYTITAYELGTEQNILRLSKGVRNLFAKMNTQANLY